MDRKILRDNVHGISESTDISMSLDLAKLLILAKGDIRYAKKSHQSLIQLGLVHVPVVNCCWHLTFQALRSTPLYHSPNYHTCNHFIIMEIFTNNTLCSDVWLAVAVSSVSQQ